MSELMKELAQCQETVIDSELVFLTINQFRNRLREQRGKGRYGWHDHEVVSDEDLQKMLMKNIYKSDFLDAAIICMMLHLRREVL